MRFIFITLEFTAGTFSGNGVYGQSQVRSLAGLGHDLLVISGKPSGYADPQLLGGATALIEVSLPVWHRLDRGSGWKQLADGVVQQEGTVEAVIGFNADAVLGVDWSSLPTYKALKTACQARGAALAPYVHMNYRVYLRTAEGDDAAFMRDMETAAVCESVVVTALSRSDAQVIREQLTPPGGDPPDVKVLLPALRSDMASLPLPQDVSCHVAHCTTPHTAAPTQQTTHLINGFTNESGSTRRYLCCCVRLSPEKEPHRFVELVEQLSKSGVLQEAGITPLLVGCASTPYAQEIKERLKQAVPEAIIEERFLGPTELSQIYQSSVLNVHPCVYDAYGMTIVEAASQGAPSVVQCGGAVGATDLLREEEETVFALDLTQHIQHIVEAVGKLLMDRPRLAQIGCAACIKARSWTEAANATELVALVQDALKKKASLAT